MRIRRSRASDAPIIARMHRATIRTINAKDYPLEQIRVWSAWVTTKAHRKSHETLQKYVAVKNNKIIGYGDFNKNELHGLYVHKDHQGQGVGSALLSRMEKDAKEQGINNFHLTGTITAKPFYERYGFNVTKKTTFTIKGKKLIVYKMRKNLR